MAAGVERGRCGARPPVRAWAWQGVPAARRVCGRLRLPPSSLVLSRQPQNFSCLLGTILAERCGEPWFCQELGGEANLPAQRAGSVVPGHSLQSPFGLLLCFWSMKGLHREGTARTTQHRGIQVRGCAAWLSPLMVCSRSGAGRDNGSAGWALLFASCSAVVVADNNSKGEGGENVCFDAALSVAALWYPRTYGSSKQLLLRCYLGGFW